MKQFNDHETSCDERYGLEISPGCVMRQQLPLVTSEAALGIALRRLPRDISVPGLACLEVWEGKPLGLVSAS